MDVVLKARFGCVAVFALGALSACGNTPDAVTTTFPKTTAECTGTAIPNQFLVHYKNGETIVYKGGTRDDLIKNVIKPDIEKIEFAESDQKVQLVHPDTSTAPSGGEVIAQGASDWWHQIIESPNAWSRGFNGQGVIVAVIDSGVDVTHPLLKDHLAINPGESGKDDKGHDKATNGIDDDNNGYIDDVAGYDFNLNSGLVTDGTGHGTHVAGIIAADHSGSVFGVAPAAQILPLDFMTDDGAGNISDAIRAMYYAADRGAKVVSASWGGAPCSKSLQQAITDLGARGILFVSASGNEYADLDATPSYPAAYGLNNQITVAASTQRDIMDDYSNYSYTLVNIMAPGHQIYSTYPMKAPPADPNNTQYKALTGTSMATPFVSAAAAILWSAKPKATATEIKNALLSSVDSGRFEVSSRGRLNIRKALDAILANP